MPLYKRKPEQVFAIQWSGGSLPPNCFYGAGESFDLGCCFLMPPGAPEGSAPIPVFPGDYIVDDQGVMRPDYFENLYEQIKEE